ncbi:phosphoglycerate kinase [Pantoea sp. Aalb]|uniref:phosphoglycerate kinase n=1 Tax=Pantoea sp. Aalb TaxID=2576762 RepID=UPI001324B64E|nr:phosphoglycerate kinase [Pantoea sp. Aalb]MXP67730.1 phosphoglycerate kinase [Pantoea sp. Aalb]
MSLIRMTDLNLFNKRILIRSDLNVPIKNGIVMSDARIRASLPTIELALYNGARVMIASHLGRPIEGQYNKEFSLLPILNYIKKNNKFNGIKIHLVQNYLNGIEINAGELILLENVRFNKGEKHNDDALSKKYASLCDIFVMDAFGAAHRKQASTYGVGEFSSISCAGPLLFNELNTLSKIMSNPKRPLVAVIGGSKISTKFSVLQSLAKIADTIIVGGGIANTFIAIDNSIGQSLYEPNFVNDAKILRDQYNIQVPSYVRVSTKSSKILSVTSKKVNEIKDNEEIMDFGDETAYKMAEILKEAKTILWSGPVGVFELPDFREGTKIIAEAIAQSDAYSIVGGGDTLAAVDLFDIKENISYISTGGGAFLKFIEGEKLPVVTMLEGRIKK